MLLKPVQNMKIVLKPAFEVVSVERILSLIMPENDCFQMPQNALKVPFGHSVFWLVFTPIYHIIPAVILSFFCRLFFSLWSPTIPVGCFIWGCPVLFCMLTLWVAVCVLPLYVPSWLLRISPFWSFGKGVGGRVRSRKFRCCNSACGVNQMKKGRNPRWISAWKVCAFSVFR